MCVLQQLVTLLVYWCCWRCKLRHRSVAAEQPAVWVTPLRVLVMATASAVRVDVSSRHSSHTQALCVHCRPLAATGWTCCGRHACLHTSAQLRPRPNTPHPRPAGRIPAPSMHNQHTPHVCKCLINKSSTPCSSKHPQHSTRQARMRAHSDAPSRRPHSHSRRTHCHAHTPVKHLEEGGQTCYCNVHNEKTNHKHSQPRARACGCVLGLMPRHPMPGQHPRSPWRAAMHTLQQALLLAGGTKATHETSKQSPQRMHTAPPPRTFHRTTCGANARARATPSARSEQSTPARIRCDALARGCGRRRASQRAPFGARAAKQSPAHHSNSVVTGTHRGPEQQAMRTPARAGRLCARLPAQHSQQHACRHTNDTPAPHLLATRHSTRGRLDSLPLGAPQPTLQCC